MKNFIIIIILLVFINVPFAQNCEPVTNFSVTYTEECKAELTWDLRAKTRGDLLWNNTQNTNIGVLSCRWIWEEFSRRIMADDFYVPPGVTWTIEEVVTSGFHKTTTGEYEAPDFLGVEIYKDNGSNRPGTLIYENPFLSLIEGSFQGNMTVMLSEPVVITDPGKYWLSAYGTYDNCFSENFRFCIRVFDTPIGENTCILNEIDDAPWISTEFSSMYFALKGTKEGMADPAFKIYRDGILRATVINETLYTDEDFNLNLGHTWEVKVVCEEGGESASAEKRLPPCICHPITNGTVTFNETTATITWSAVEGAIAYKVTKDGNTETITDTVYTENYNFENATEYSWTIVTLCENGESEPVEIKATYVSITEPNITTFSIVPAYNKITISANIDFNKIEVINFLGQTVISQANDKNEVIVDVSVLANGVYFVRVFSDKGTRVKKFVKH